MPEAGAEEEGEAAEEVLSCCEELEGAVLRAPSCCEEVEASCCEPCCPDVVVLTMCEHALKPSFQVCSLPGSSGELVHEPSQDPPVLQQFGTPLEFFPHEGQAATSESFCSAVNSCSFALFGSEAYASLNIRSAAAEASAIASLLGSAPRPAHLALPR